MAIVYQPKKILKKMVGKNAVDRLITKRFTVNKAAAKLLARAGVLSADQIAEVALTVAKDYKARYDDQREEGASAADAHQDATADNKLLADRVKAATLNEVTNRVKSNYHGEFYIWLPSTAAHPRVEHVVKYGKKYRLGRGEAPGDEYGCQCGMKILVDGNELDLEDDE